MIGNVKLRKYNGNMSIKWKYNIVFLGYVIYRKVKDFIFKFSFWFEFIFIVIGIIVLGNIIRVIIVIFWSWENVFIYGGVKKC